MGGSSCVGQEQASSSGRELKFVVLAGCPSSMGRRWLVPIAAARFRGSCDTINNAIALLKIGERLGVSVLPQSCLSASFPESGPRFCSSWPRTTQLGQLLMFPIGKQPSLTEGTDSTSRLLNACVRSADPLSLVPSYYKRNVSKFGIYAFTNQRRSCMRAAQHYV